MDGKAEADGMSRKTCQKMSISPEQRGLCSGGRVYSYLLEAIKLKI